MSLTQISDGRGEVGTANTTLPQRECWKLGNKNCLETPCTPLYSVVLHVLYCTNHQTSACFNHSLRPVQDAENQFFRVSPFSPRRMEKRMVQCNSTICRHVPQSELLLFHINVLCSTPKALPPPRPSNWNKISN